MTCIQQFWLVDTERFLTSQQLPVIVRGERASPGAACSFTTYTIPQAYGQEIVSAGAAVTFETRNLLAQFDSPPKEFATAVASLSTFAVVTVLKQFDRAPLEAVSAVASLSTFSSVETLKTFPAVKETVAANASVTFQSI